MPSAIDYVFLNAVVTPLRKAASYEPRIAILGIWGDYVAISWQIRHLRGSTWKLRGPLRGLRDAFCHVNSALFTVVSLRGGNKDTLVSAA